MGDRNPRYKTENIITLELDLPERSTFDFDRHNLGGEASLPTLDSQILMQLVIRFMQNCSVFGWMRNTCLRLMFLQPIRSCFSSSKRSVAGVVGRVRLGQVRQVAMAALEVAVAKTEGNVNTSRSWRNSADTVHLHSRNLYNLCQT